MTDYHYHDYVREIYRAEAAIRAARRALDASEQEYTYDRLERLEAIENDINDLVVRA